MRQGMTKMQLLDAVNVVNALKKGALVMIACALLAGCNALPRLGAVPDRFAARAVLLGLEDIRYVVGDEQDMQRLSRDVADTWPRERTWLAAQGKSINTLPPSNLLALSGAGDYGAFGAC